MVYSLQGGVKRNDDEMRCEEVNGVMRFDEVR